MGLVPPATMGPMSLRSCGAVLLLALMSGCPSDPASECSACTASEFCCLGVCTPLGGSCGDGGVIDAPVVLPDVPAPDAPPDRCAPGEGVVSVESLCAGDTRVSCTGAGERSCLLNDRVCVDWVDGGGVAHGSCVPATEAEVCDPATDAPGCDGTRIVRCLPSSIPPALEPAPAGFLWQYDCLDHAADARCEAGPTGAGVCVSPTDVPCDPDTAAASCERSCRIAPHTAFSGVERPYRCASGEQCVLNTYSFDRPACVPLDATPSEGPNEDLSCVSSDVIHLRQYGYEFDRPCSEVVFGGPTRCYDAPPAEIPAHCVDATAEACDPARYVATCVDSRESYCSEGWLTDQRACVSLDGSLFLPGPCDARGEHCIVGAPCDASFVPYCAAAEYRIVCLGGRTASFRERCS